jgi:hypothetical protein
VFGNVPRALPDWGPGLPCIAQSLLLRRIDLRLMAMGSTPPIRCEIRAELLPATEKGLQTLANTAAVRAEVRRAGGLKPVVRLIDSERCLEVTYEVEANDAEKVAQRAKEVIRDTAAAFWGDAITWRINGIGIAPPWKLT